MALNIHFFNLNFLSSITPKINPKELGLLSAAVGTVAVAALGWGRAAALTAGWGWGVVYLIRLGSKLEAEPSKNPASPVFSVNIAPYRPIVISTSNQSGRCSAPPRSEYCASITEKMQKWARSGQIFFYNHTVPATEWLGNFYPASIRFKGWTYRNAEAAFQAQKFVDYPDIMRRFTMLSGDEAFHFAHDYAKYVRPDWKQIHVQTMREILECKVNQHPDIAEWLRATGDAYLIEHNPVKGRDIFWSDDHDGSGLNMLGKLWMEVRSAID